ncbi:flagellar biosynthesis anti-sigma factor FlgM [Chungangia koreensis]|uniref:Negative regulator of flagellin synthesis n=1 Tax=Chungangia koreensis TaxID=752657 RepID=A0ABV8X1F8_9LACT
MKINPNLNVNNVNPYKRNQLKTEAAKSAAKVGADKLEISDAAKQLSGLTSYPAERAERVQQLKAQVEAGTYKPDAAKVAEDLLKFYKG